MVKRYFKTEGYEPDVFCTELCEYKDRPSENVTIGSASCQECVACYGWDSEENWIKCLNYAPELIKNEENKV